MTELYVDVDSHRFYPEILRVAERYGFELYIVTRNYLVVGAKVHLILAEDKMKGGAWIGANVGRGDICITGDPSLAASCAVRDAIVLQPSGPPWNGEIKGSGGSSIVNFHAASGPRNFAEWLEGAIAAGRAAAPRALAPPASIGGWYGRPTRWVRRKVGQK